MQQPHRSRSLLSRLVGTVMVGVVRGVFAFSRALGPERSGALGAAIAAHLRSAPPPHRTALANIRAAYPEKSDAEVKAIALAAPGTISAAPAANIRISAACSISIPRARRPAAPRSTASITS